MDLTDDFKRGVLVGLALAEVLDPDKRQTAFLVLFERWKMKGDVSFDIESQAIMESLGDYEKRGS